MSTLNHSVQSLYIYTVVLPTVDLKTETAKGLWVGTVHRMNTLGEGTGQADGGARPHDISPCFSKPHQLQIHELFQDFLYSTCSDRGVLLATETVEREATGKCGPLYF